MEKILTFDCYGTLIDTSPIYNAVEVIAEKHGFDGKTARNIFTNYEDRLMSIEDYIPYNEVIYQALEYCDLEMVCDVFHKNYEQILSVHENIEPFPDVLEALHTLKENGYQLALMSNSGYSIMQYNLKALDNIFDKVILAQDTHVYKPQLAFFEYAEKELNLKEKEHCHIAKGYWWDIVPCSKIGWKKIWLNRDHKSGMKKHMPYQEIYTLDELLKIL
ncbi:MAG: HAD family hydrolase [Clostridia bacterium]|jgi:2-haloacid dehalogenase|nr:HAD family hydrolase [Clostridia bacterium]MCI2015559.1 HAD family hydrolase [Clostridia bacterium]